MTRIAYRIVLQGFVQGQGVRPAVAQLAEREGWCGTVRNTSEGVELRLAAEGLTPAVIEAALRSTLAGLAGLRIDVIPDAGWTGFAIDASTDDAGLATPVPRDVAVCEECLTEANSPGNRRFRYGLTSCATCGPRYSVLLAMPFDRERTSLRAFPLCPECRQEYDSASDRRRHAQTMACPQCGPQVWIADREGRQLAAGDEAAEWSAHALCDGRILALRGVGGYQLLVDATSSAAVRELRRRKGRPAKPFAVLCRSIAEARRLGELDILSERELLSPANPIVLVSARPGTALAEEVHPHMRDVGLLLPTTALHARLAELANRPLVCTSGNEDGEPLAFAVDEAEKVLRGIADLFLHHDREIVRPIDDSVVRPMGGRPVTLRCARGLAPLPLELSGPPVLALGAQLKSACAWSNGRQAVLGPHVGDLQGLGTRERWTEQIAALSELYRLDRPRLVVDAHPEGFPWLWAQTTDREVQSVWHHHAHVVAGMLEHGWCDRTVLGVAADGTGWGPDETLWGGEVLLASLAAFRRVAHVRRFSLPGGEVAIRDTWRVAAAVLGQLDELSLPQIAGCVNRAAPEVRQMLELSRSAMAAKSTGLGRLFDAAACVILGLTEVSFEGEGAMRLEAACDPSAQGEYPWHMRGDELIEIDWRPAWRALVADRMQDVSPGVMAERFHRGVTAWMVELARRWPRLNGLPPDIPVVFSGGVFQNRRLIELLVERWPAECGPLGLPGRIPPNDGGLAAGQLAMALARSPHSSPDNKEL